MLMVDRTPRAFISCGDMQTEALTVGALPNEIQRSALLVKVFSGFFYSANIQMHCLSPS